MKARSFQIRVLERAFEEMQEPFPDAQEHIAYEFKADLVMLGDGIAGLASWTLCGKPIPATLRPLLLAWDTQLEHRLGEISEGDDPERAAGARAYLEELGKYRRVLDLVREIEGVASK